MKTCNCSTEQIKDKGFKSENGELYCQNCSRIYIQSGTDGSTDYLVEDSEIQNLRKNISAHRRGALTIWIVIVINTLGGLAWSQIYKSPDYSTGSGSISSAMSNYDINNISATTVYQQQVVNGWVAKDLLEAIGDQNSTMIEMQSEKSGISAFLLFNILFTLGLIGIIILRIGFMINDQIRLNYLESLS